GLGGGRPGPGRRQLIAGRRGGRVPRLRPTRGDEAREEAGLVIRPDDVEFAHVVHLVDPPGTRPRMQMIFRARRWTGTPEVLEPDKCLGWGWWHPHDLPDPTVPYTRAAIQAIQAGCLYTEIGWT
ncbi:NUDIX domain-containing protein, partial [Streptomyces microflavus]